MNTHISIREVSVTYDATSALNKISLEIPRGASTVILGESGCGKSTLLRLIAGLQTATAGQIVIDGGKDGIGFMPQTYGLMPWQTARENILLPYRLGRSFLRFGKHNLSIDDENRLSDLAEQLGITEIMERYPKEMSGGQKQRVALARVFFARAPILLMDEPFSALDAITREEMQQVFGRLRKTVGMTSILVTHDAEEAAILGDKIVIMKKDSIVGGQIAAILDGKPFDRTDRDTAEFFAKSREIRKILAQTMR